MEASSSSEMQEAANVPQRPTERSHVGVAKKQKTKRASFKSGDTVLLKNNSTGLYDWRVTVVGKAVWDEDRHGYNYSCRDASGVMLNRMIPETELKE